MGAPTTRMRGAGRGGDHTILAQGSFHSARLHTKNRRSASLKLLAVKIAAFAENLRDARRRRRFADPMMSLLSPLSSRFANMLHLLAATLLVVTASRWFWRFALRRYSSASS